MEEDSPFMGPSYIARLSLVNEQAAESILKKFRNSDDNKGLSEELLQRIASSQSSIAANLLRDRGMRNCRFTVASEFSCVDDAEDDENGCFIELTIEPNFFCSEEDFDMFSSVLEGPIFTSAGERSLKRDITKYLAESDLEDSVAAVEVEMSGFGYG